jgi:hypothetical protein
MPQAVRARGRVHSIFSRPSSNVAGAAMVIGRRRSAGAACLALLPSLLPVVSALSGTAPAARADLSAPGEALLKVQYIERFTRFVDWPAELLGEKQALFIVCIAGNGSVAETLPQAIAFERVKGKPLAFRWVRPGDDLGSCHLMYVGPGEGANLPAYLASTLDRPVLTVADVPGGAGRGALIGFYRDGDRVLFEINRAAADRSGLKVSARLLRLARLVGPDKG